MNEETSSSCQCQASADDKRSVLSTEMPTGQWFSRYRVAKMDCPSEERMIRMALDSQPEVHHLSFDLSGRTLSVVHDGAVEAVTAKLEPLGLGAKLEQTEPFQANMAEELSPSISPAEEAAVLKALLAINGVMFLLELALGVVAQSMGLIADSLDMFADAAVYGLALYAVAHSARTQMQAARLAGVLQLLLAIGVLLEVGRRVWMGSDPVSGLMMGVAALALIANVSCLALLAKHRDGGVHMQASWIFSANDVLINLGVILAGALVYATASALPDLIIGAAVGLIVLNGARRILALQQGSQAR